MPTNANAYNSRLTDESLEKRFRDTFRSQGGAELVDDLYASGVIVPVVDFTSAAEGSQLGQNLQTAWDFSTGHSTVVNTTTTLISTSGFWQVDLNCVFIQQTSAKNAFLVIDDGTTQKIVWELNSVSVSSVSEGSAAIENKFVVFLRAGDSLKASSNLNAIILDVWYRQIATVTGDLVNPTGFTSS